MTDKPSDITEANEDAKDTFAGKSTAKTRRPQDGESVTEVNEAANAQFNGDDSAETSVTPTRVGVLRGSSD